MNALEVSNLRAFYTREQRNESEGDIFQDAVRMFSLELSNDPEKLKWIVDGNHVNVDSIISTVENARAKYESRKGDPGVTEALTSLAEKIHHYSGIMDVIVSHHPEYTALFWGATKFLLVGAMNHQKVITRLSEGLVQIANILPMADVTARLYPIPQIRKIIEAIYAHTIRFLIRALHWYQEGKLKHILHSITRPTEIRYDDILDNIATLTRHMSDTAMASSHAEQRDMHLELLKQTKGQETLQSSLVSQKAIVSQISASVGSARSEQHNAFSGLRHLITGGQDGINEQLAAILIEVMTIKSNMHAIQATANVVLERQLSTFQVCEILASISVAQLPNAQAAYQTSSFLARKRRSRPSNRGPPFWLEDNIQQWNSCSTSSVAIVEGTRKMRFHLQWFCTETISLLRESGIPVVWALNTMIPGGDNTAANGVSSVDMIKYLVSQIILLNQAMHTEAAMSERIRSSQTAISEDDWIDVLGSVLRGLSLLYVVLDVEVLSQTQRGALASLNTKLSSRKVTTVVKVVLVNYGLPLQTHVMDKSFEANVVKVRRTKQPPSILTRLPRRGKALQGVTAGESLDLARLTGQGLRGRQTRGRGGRWR